MKKRKSVLVAILALFLFQTQAMASVDHERDILAGSARNSIPGKEERDKAPSAGPVEEEPDTAANRERDILSGKAQHAIPTKKEQREERERGETHRAPLRSITDEPETAADRERDILSGKAQRSVPRHNEKGASAKDKAAAEAQKAVDQKKDAARAKETSDAVTAKSGKPENAAPAKEVKNRDSKNTVEKKEEKRPRQSVSAADREKEILSGKAQRSTRVQ